MVGQSQDRTETPREPYNEAGNNGLVLSGKYIPEELLAEFLCQLDNETLWNCQLVCKRWAILIRNYVWRKKAEVTFSRPRKLDTDMPWRVYYLIAMKKSFEKI